MQPELSIVVPVYRNADTLNELSQRLHRVLVDPLESFELVLVVDACPAESLPVAAGLAKEHDWITCLALPTNRGQQQAILAGLRQATGKCVAVMDADLQDPPEALLVLYQALHQNGCGAVFAARVGMYQSPGRMITSRLFKWVMMRAASLPKGSGCFLIMTDTVKDAVIAQASKNFYLPVSIARTRFPMTSVDVPRNRRPSGRSAYTMSKRIKVALSHFKYLLKQNKNAPPTL